jgi:hypothetical protein
MAPLYPNLDTQLLLTGLFIQASRPGSGFIRVSRLQPKTLRALLSFTKDVRNGSIDLRPEQIGDLLARFKTDQASLRQDYERAQQGQTSNNKKKKRNALSRAVKAILATAVPMAAVWHAIQILYPSGSWAAGSSTAAIRPIPVIPAVAVAIGVAIMVRVLLNLIIIIMRSRKTDAASKHPANQKHDTPLDRATESGA